MSGYQGSRHPHPRPHPHHRPDDDIVYDRGAAAPSGTRRSMMGSVGVRTASGARVRWVLLLVAALLQLLLRGSVTVLAFSARAQEGSQGSRSGAVSARIQVVQVRAVGLSTSRGAHALPSSIVLRMGRRRGGAGKLGDLVDLTTGAATPTDPPVSSANPNGRGRSTKAKKLYPPASSAETTSGGISPLLAQWAATSRDESRPGEGADNSGRQGGDASTAVAVDSTPRPSPTKTAPRVTSSSSRTRSSSRRQRQSQRLEVERERDEAVQRAVRNLRVMLSDDDDEDEGGGDDNANKKATKEPFQVDRLLELLEELLDLPSSVGNLRQLTAGSQPTDYRLAWVGSDETVCHLGTGLHKVKLARLQEVFLTLGPKSKVQMYEVIRILGPFPNVKNTLVGTSVVVVDAKARNAAARDIQPWKITWQSLIDGTGKEILAGTKVRDVDLDVLWCDKNLIVCAAVAAPAETEGATNSQQGPPTKMLVDGGRDLFVFVREDNMERKLDALRVI